MKDDSLDRLLCDDRILDDEWIALGKALSISGIIKKSPLERAKQVNKEIRHFFGNTIRNLIRNIYEPDYKDPILKEAMEICDIDTDITNMLPEKIEEEIYKKLTDSFKEQHWEEWKSCKDDSTTFFNQLIDIGQNARSLLDIARDAAIKGGVVAVMARLINTPAAVAFGVNNFLFDSNWKKVLPAILIISVIRKRLKICDIFR